MRDKISSVPWKRLLWSAATFMTMVLAAGAKWKPK
jgi:hypothetical protein